MMSTDTFGTAVAPDLARSPSSSGSLSAKSDLAKIIEFPQLFEENNESSSKTQRHFYFDSASIPQISNFILKRNFNLLSNQLFINSHSNGGQNSMVQRETLKAGNSVTSSPYHQSSSTIEDVQNVRNMILAHFNALPGVGITDKITSSICSSAATDSSIMTDEFEVVFTSGATGALSLIASSIVIPAVTLATYVVQICSQLTSFLQTSSSSNTSSAQVWFLDVNHTSVIGMTPLLQARFPHSKFRFLSFDETEHFLSTSSAAPAPFLFCFPAQCNFSGARYPVDKWTSAFQQRGSLVLVDAASYCSTATLDVR